MPRSRLLVLVVLLAALVGGGFYFGYRAKAEDRELPVYTLGGERLAAGEEIYRRGSDAKPFTYPPFAAVPFVPFRAVPKDWQPAVWFAVNFAILVAVFGWLRRFASRSLPGLGAPRLGWFWLVVGLVGCRHVLSVLTNQSHDLFLAGLLAATAAAWSRGRASAGLWAGVAAATKATPLLCLVLFALRRHWLAGAALLAGAAACTALPDLVWPRADGRSWAVAWYEVNLAGLRVGGTADAAGAWNPHSFLNQSLSGALARWFTPVQHPGPFVIGAPGETLVAALPEAGFRAATLLAQALVLGAIAFGVLAAGRAVRRAADRAVAQAALGLGEVAAIACGMVLLSPQSSKSHFCVWLLPAAFLAERLLRGRRDPVGWLLLALAAVLGTLASKDLLGSRLGNLLLAYGNVTGCTLVLLAATVRALHRAAGELAPPAGSAP